MLTLQLLTKYIQDLQHDKLQYTTLRAYIGITVDWLADLVGRGIIPGIPSGRGRLYTADGTRKALLQLLTKPRMRPQAPRIPSLLRLPAYYPEQLAAFQRRYGGLTIRVH